MGWVAGFGLVLLSAFGSVYSGMAIDEAIGFCGNIRGECIPSAH